MKPEEFRKLQQVCRLISKVKEQIIPELPHFGSQALFFQNDEITTGQLNNKIEIKIHLITNQLLAFDNEKGNTIDLGEKNISDNVKESLSKFGLDLTQYTLDPIDTEELRKFLPFAELSKRVLELFRMRLRNNFSLVHLWPHHFDLSVEWFSGYKDEQIGTGISPGDEQDSEAYLYMNPWPFNEKLTNASLVIGDWHTNGWNGIKVKWSDLIKDSPTEIVEKLFQNFEIQRDGFDKH